jgi:hypothetical protein
VTEPSSHDLWARFRFSVVGPLLASPPSRGALHEELERLSAKICNFSITPGIRDGWRLKVATSGHRQRNMLQSEA